MSQEHVSQSGLRVVVLGFHESGKTSLINTFLNQTGPEFWKITDSCVKREGEVCRRKLICIDTPGWWREYPLSDTADFIKQKIVLSVRECLPGPHAFLLIIDINNVPFTEKIRRSVEEHMGLFGERVWEHTIVVFTRGEYLEGKSLEQHIEIEGEALKWLVEKCGNRCHMFNIVSTESCDEVDENMNKLLKQIDGMVTKYGNSGFELDEKILREVEENRNTHQERAKMRQQKVMDQREMLHKYGVPSLSELTILLLGWLISGKTAAKDTVLGQVDHVNKRRTYTSERMFGEVAGRQVSVVDTPGWWKYLPAECNPEWVKTELQRALTLDSKAPHAILLAVPADTTFPEEQRKITEDNMKMFGDDIWRHTMVLFTCGDRLTDTSIEEHIEGEGAPLQWLVEKCGNRYHVLSWYDKEEKVVELLKKIEEMVAGNSLFRPGPEAQEPVDKKTNLKEVPTDIVQFLDQKWQKMDRELEKAMATIFSKTTSKLKGSMDDPGTKFRDDHPCSEGTSKEIHSGKGTSPQNTSEPKYPIKKSGINAATGLGDKEQTRERPAGQMERMKEKLEMEWGRRELGVIQRFQRQLSELRQSGSEADVHDLNQSYRKVVWWFHHNNTSGYASNEEEFPTSSSCSYPYSI
ncbi:GTPase IMAP family member 8-like [Sardina pilchardus]|uniref:GTPase IMAP family member 8-like n=1 Tax=Sardina pilchardus TaxID=27697 RepID=UPI002E11157A